MLYGNSCNSLMFLLSGVALSCLTVCGNTITAAVASALSVGYCLLFNSTADIAVMFLICGVLPGILLGISYRKALPLSYLTAIPACLFAAGWGYLFYSYKSAFGINMFESAVGEFSRGFDKSLMLVAQQYGDKIDNEVLTLLSDTMKQAYDFILNMVPCMIIIYSCIMALALVWFSKKTAHAAGCAPVASFSEIYAPSSVSLLCFICLLGTFLAKNSMYFFMNILAVLMGYYMLCGISLSDFFLKRYVEKPGVRLLLYFILFFVGGLLLPHILFTLFAVAGMADTLFDFRKLRTATDFPEE